MAKPTKKRTHGTQVCRAGECSGLASLHAHRAKKKQGAGWAGSSASQLQLATSAFLLAARTLSLSPSSHSLRHRHSTFGKPLIRALLLGQTKCSRKRSENKACFSSPLINSDPGLVCVCVCVSVCPPGQGFVSLGETQKLQRKRHFSWLQNQRLAACSRIVSLACLTPAQPTVCGAVLSKHRKYIISDGRPALTAP